MKVGFARKILFVVFSLLLLQLPQAVQARSHHAYVDRDVQEIAVADLPFEAQQTLRAIERGGPFAYERDGVVFGNYEHALPKRPRGYYHEYTVKTPGGHGRGARRIIAGNQGEYYYTQDHYRTFRRIRE